MTAPLHREPGLRITGACPRNAPDRPSTASDCRQQQPANMKLVVCKDACFSLRAVDAGEDRPARRHGYPPDHRDPAAAGVCHVAGVGLQEGTELRADLVVDATGRRSRLSGLLPAIGAPPPIEEREDCGFVYYARHFRGPGGSIPEVLGPILQDYGSISSLTLPADNGTWGVGEDCAATRACRRRSRPPDSAGGSGGGSLSAAVIRRLRLLGRADPRRARSPCDGSRTRAVRVAAGCSRGSGPPPSRPSS